MQSSSTGYDIAVIGLAGRFPGARDLRQFWHNLRAGVESVKFFSDDELRTTGVPGEHLQDPAYVKAQPILEDFDKFDAAFFGLSPQDAAIMDPQHRLFLEVGWEALEDAGHEPESFAGNVGVFATCGMNTYMMYNLIGNQRVMETVGEWLVRHTGNDMNFLATRLSYELNLKGPSMNVQTACSSALVAVHQACVSLLSGECDMALAGGSTLVLPQNRGYVFKPNEILSPDGHCRPFDAQARGTLFGSGTGVLVLRRLADALADGDRVLAVVKGSAINNDGSAKVGYLAPSVQGQSRAITEALAVSGLSPETISYVEAHGTGTIIGDPIELVALTQAYRQFTQKKAFCAIGSVKSNIGHLGEAAGAAALIKTVLALKHREIPPSLHYTAPNPEFDFAQSPFFVNAQLSPWPTSAEPRRAGVTSLGAGGTNCHVIVEEPTPLAPSGPSRPWQLLVLSAKTPTALETATSNLAAHLKEHPEFSLADVAYTLHSGRKAFAHRRAVVSKSLEEAARICESKQGIVDSNTKAAERGVAFLFPGQGAQFANMGRGLYESESVFRSEFDQCAEILQRDRGLNIRDVIFPSNSVEQAQERLKQTAVAQPALFVIEYALAKLWMSWGVRPHAMLGHSIGEYVAACLADVFSLSNALALVADRGRCMQEAPAGAMLAVSLSASEVEKLLTQTGRNSTLAIAVVNGPEQSVVAGADETVTAFAKELDKRSIQCQRLQTSHAFHSPLMEPILASFSECVRRVSLHPPTIPYVSNLTGTWARSEDATSPDYWVRHLRRTVRFSECLATLTTDPAFVLLEVGPGRSLCGLAKQQAGARVPAVPSLGRAGEEAQDLEKLLTACARLWVLGCNVDARGLYDGQHRQRVSLPTYPFERKRFWIEPDPPKPSEHGEQPAQDKGEKDPDIANWFYRPAWKRSVIPAQATCPPDAPADWLVFIDECGLGSDLIELLREPRSLANGESLGLEISAPGDIDSLRIRSTVRPQPGRGDVEIRVSAAALNFADVLKAAGVFPDAPFGMECAGVIERVGPNVTDFRPGDEVVAIGPESFHSFVVRQARLVARRPEFLSMEEAVTLPAAFMTAWFALHRVTQLGRGERILIHAASGGVGLAAVQIARLAGAEIFATAGNNEKRAYLQSLGIRHVFDSRSPEFAEQIMERTRGLGVDIVVNSLTGDFIPKSLALLADGGRFLELGKREIYSSAQLARLQLRSRVAYHPIDLTRLLADDPEAYGQLHREVIELARRRQIAPLPRHIFAFSDAASAFRLMLQARHIGKIVLSMNSATPDVYSVRPGAAFQQVNRHEFVIRPGHADDYTALLQCLNNGRARIGHVAHLWNVTVDAAEPEPVTRSLERGFFCLLSLAKAIGSHEWAHSIDLAVLATGLVPVASEINIQPVKATLHGPCRVIPREYPNVTCRMIDVPASAPGSWQRTRLVEQLKAELTADSRERVVAYRNTDRWIPALESASLRPAAHNGGVRPGGVYLITGGLGGLGLEIARHLARTAKANLILVSRTPLPPPQEWERCSRSDSDDPTAEVVRKLRECEAAGGTVHVARADVTDSKAMRAVVTDARKRFGAIHGVIHAAGTLDDGLIQLKTPESALNVLAPKLQGALVLDDVLGDQPLDFFVLFSSISSILGLQGQVDYTAANAFLDAFATFRSARRPGQTVAINWSAWQEVGMAARSAPPRRPGSGAIGDARTRHPWLKRRYDSGRAITFVTGFNRTDHWLLGEHAVRGGAGIMPGTGYLELARAALAEITETPATQISRVVFLAPFGLVNGESKELAFTLQPAKHGWDFCITSDSGSVTHVTGHLAPATESPPGRIDIARLTGTCNVRTELLNGFLKQSFMDFGPRWGNVREIRFGQDQALVTLELAPAFVADLDSFRLHPALLDMATGGAQPLIPGFDASKDFYVPFSYGRLVVWNGFCQKLYSHVRLRAVKTQGLAIFDITIADQQGTVAAEISDFVMKRVSSLSVERVSRESRGTPLSTPAAVLAGEILRNGIGPADGVVALDRILSCGIAPQIVVSPVNPTHWLAQADALLETTQAGAATSTALEARPTARRSEAPTSGDEAIETGLSELYRQILGVDTVSPHDDFFELGGHSLLAVRLLTRIEKKFGKAIALSELFKSATIEHLAAILRGAEAPKRQEFHVVVPFTEHGRGPAFYCVHSIGGEVASFRHLARYLGPDQRFFGIQVPPEHQNAEFASSIESMARYYVDALIAFQPDGPYVLGGWSAGSTIALEMAQQLLATGRRVELLIALDGAPFIGGVGTSWLNPLFYWKLARNFPHWVADDLLLDFSFPAFARRVWNKLVALGKSVTGALRGKASREVSGFMDTSHYSPNQAGLMNAMLNALYAYKPKPYTGRVVLYKARTQPLYHLLEVEKAWMKTVSELDVVVVKGTHVSMVRDPYIRAIADDLRRRPKGLAALPLVPSGPTLEREYVGANKH